MDPAAVAEEIDAAARALAPSTTAEARALRRKWTRVLRASPARDVLGAATALLERHGQRFLAYELIRFHSGALALVDRETAERLGQGMGSWGEVDMFGTLVAGQAWRRGHVADGTVADWARHPDRWWRRAALVSTVPLNVRNQGGAGDPPRTLAVCALLVDDRDAYGREGAVLGTARARRPRSDRGGRLPQHPPRPPRPSRAARGGQQTAYGPQDTNGGASTALSPYQRRSAAQELRCSPTRDQL